MGDFSAKVQYARRKLWDYASQFRTQNVRYKMPFNKLYVRNEVYAYDHLNESVVLVKGWFRVRTALHSCLTHPECVHT